jgi:hypothetical protein
LTPGYEKSPARRAVFVAAKDDEMLIDAPTRPVIARGSRLALPFPAEVEMILSAMEAGRHAWNQEAGQEPNGEERREAGRVPYRVRAELHLFRDQPGAPPWVLYVRDADVRGMGFLSPHRLPLGYGGYVELIAPTGRPLSVPCTLFRCREVVPGWYDGAMNFNREQGDFQF